MDVFEDKLYSISLSKDFIRNKVKEYLNDVVKISDIVISSYNLNDHYINIHPENVDSLDINTYNKMCDGLKKVCHDLMGYELIEYTDLAFKSLNPVLNKLSQHSIEFNIDDLYLNASTPIKASKFRKVPNGFNHLCINFQTKLATEWTEVERITKFYSIDRAYYIEYISNLFKDILNIGQIFIYKHSKEYFHFDIHFDDITDFVLLNKAISALSELTYDISNKIEDSKVFAYLCHIDDRIRLFDQGENKIFTSVPGGTNQFKVILKTEKELFFKV